MSERFLPVTPADALYAQVYAERFGAEPPTWERPDPAPEDRLADALAATEGQRQRRSRNGPALR